MKGLAFGLIALACSSLMLATPAWAQTADIEARIDEKDVARSSDDRPVELDPRRQQILFITVRNNTEEPLTVRSIRLRGEVIGLTFFSYDTRVGMQIPPGGSEERRFELDLFGLDGQAVGLIGSKVVALDEEREPVTEVGMVADVRGSLGSVYGIFGLGISAFAVVSLIDVLVRLKMRRLPRNRWARGVRFLTPGFGLGLSLIFTLSALRIYHPTTGKWASLLFGSGALFFLLGYLTPSPGEEDLDEEEVPEAAPPLAAAMPSVPVRPAGVSGAGQAALASPAPANAPGGAGFTMAAPPPPAEQPAATGTVAAPPPPAVSTDVAAVTGPVAAPAAAASSTAIAVAPQPEAEPGGAQAGAPPLAEGVEPSSGPLTGAPPPEGAEPSSGAPPGEPPSAEGAEPSSGPLTGAPPFAEGVEPFSGPPPGEPEVGSAPEVETVSEAGEAAPPAPDSPRGTVAAPVPQPAPPPES